MRFTLACFIAFLFTLTACLEKEEVVNTYVYINSTGLFLPPSDGRWISQGEIASIFVDDHTAPGLLTSLAFKTDDGETYSVNLDDVYNLFNSGAGDMEPIPIPNREYTKMVIGIRNAITGMRYNTEVYADYSILGRAPISGEFDIRYSGLYQVNTMQNYEPFVSPSGKTYNGMVRRIELISDTQISVNAGQDENYYEYAPDIAVHILNQDKQSGGGSSSCLNGTWERSICGGTKKAIVTFNNGTGTFQDEDCSGICSSPGRYFTFTYTILSSSEMQVNYTSGQICGQSNVPTGGVQPYSCNGNTLQFGNAYTRQ